MSASSRPSQPGPAADSDNVVETEIIDVSLGAQGDDPAEAPGDGSHGESASKDRENTRWGSVFEGGVFEGGVFDRLNVEVDPDAVQESIARLTAQVQKAASAGRYTKVRIKYRGKALGPDIPLSVFVAAEAVSFVYAGVLRALIVNLGVRAVLEVEFIHAADEDVAEGRSAWEAGEVEAAEAALMRALHKAPHHVEARYRLGVLLRVTGRRAEAMAHLEQVAQAEGEYAERAAEALARMARGPRTL